MAKQIKLTGPFFAFFSLSAIYFFFLFSGVIVLGQDQPLTQAEFTRALVKAYSGSTDTEAIALIRAQRLFVKPSVNELITESIVKELKGKTMESQEAFRMAENTATSFEKVYGERSLSIGVSYLKFWTREQKEKKLVADSLYAAGTKLRLGNEPDEAIKCFQIAQEIYKTILDERGEAEVLGGLGAVYFNNKDDYQRALAYYNDALIMREKVDDKFLIGNTLNSLGAISYKSLQNYPQAILYYDRADSIRSEIGDSAGVRSTQSNMAFAFKSYGYQLNTTGMFNEAIDCLEKAYKLDIQIDASLEVAEVLSLMGYVYSKLGDFNIAATKLTEAEKIMRSENDSLGLAGVFNHFGIVFQRAGRPEKAMSYYTNSIKIYELKGDPSDELAVIDNLGTLVFDQKDYTRAEEYHVRGLKISREVGDQEKEVDYLLNLANDQILLGKLDEAMANYEEGLKIARIMKNPDLIWRITAGMAECYESEGEYEKAVALNDSALKIIDGLRNTLKSTELKASFLARERFAFEDIIALLQTLHEKDKTKGYDKLAFNYAERSKSRVLLDLLGGSISETNYDSIENSKIRYPHPVSLDEAKALCPDKNTVLLEYTVGDSSSCLWVITRTNHQLFKIPDRKTLQEKIEVLRFALLDPEQTNKEYLVRAGDYLYQELIKPAEPYFSKKSNLVIIPDGILNYLPFEVLLTESEGIKPGSSYSDFPFLVKKYPLSYVQSASVLSSLLSTDSDSDKSKTRNRKLIAFGDPFYENATYPSIASGKSFNRLEYSGKEIEMISSFFDKGCSEVYLRKDATESNVKREGKLKEFNYIHFATHGIIDEDKPDLSSLLLTPDKNTDNDGLLQAKEIFNLKLNANLVVLSACQTGLGKLVRGEGMIGLTRAFMCAGTPSVLVSLWSVSDISTATLIEEFYKNLIKNKLSNTDALRKAQFALMRDEKYSHPFYWAPFVLVGDWR
jgi:CHAT domain-containing protein/Tfp pilus assembly protein PilF